MRDLCYLMENGDDYSNYDNEDHGSKNEDVLGSSQLFGMALTFGDLIAEEEAESLISALNDESDDMQDPADIFESIEGELEERVSLKSRFGVNAPAFERYVYERCGIKL